MLRKALLTMALLSLLLTSWPVQAAAGPTQRLGTGVATAIAAAPNGAVIAVGSSIGVWFFTADTLAPLGFWDTGEWVVRVQYSTDGRYLRANDLYWEVGRTSAVPAVPAETVWLEHACSPNHQYCVQLEAAHVVVTDRDTLIDVAVIQTETIHDTAWSPDGQTLYTVGQRTAAWAIPSGKLKRSLTAFFTDAVGLVGWSADGRVVGNDYEAWEVDHGQPVTPPICPAGQGLTHGQICGTDRLATYDEYLGDGAVQYKLRVYTNAEKTRWRWIVPHTSMTNFASLSADGTRLVTSGYDAGQNPCGGYLYWCSGSVRCEPTATTRIWAVDTFELLAQLPVGFCQAYFLPGNTQIIGITSEALEVWDWPSQTRRWSTPTQAGLLALSPNAQYAATTTADTVNLWRVDTGALIQVLTGHTAPSDKDWQRTNGYDVRWPFGVGGINGPAFSPDGTQLAASGDDGTVLIWPVP